MSKLSVVIVNYNTCDLLLACLLSVYEALDSLSDEVWVVDNASTDGSPEAVRQQFPQVRLIENQMNVGFSRANNQALRQSSGDICILLNPDTLVVPGFFIQLLAAFQANPQAGMIAPQLMNSDHTIQPSWGQFSSAWTEFFFQFLLYKIFPSPFPLGKRIHPRQRKAYANTHQIDWASGACLAVKNDALAKVGLLDENIFMYGEDMEWCWRFKKNDYEVIYCPEIKVIHFAGQSSKRDFSRWIQNYTAGELRFIAANRSWAELLLAILFIIIGSFIRMVIFGIVYPFWPQKRISYHQRIQGYWTAVKMAAKAIRNTGPIN